MPTSTVTEENPFKLPEDEYLPATLISCVEQSFPYTIKKGPKAGQRDTFTKWTWEFKIADGQYAGLHASLDTDAKVTVTPDGNRNVPAMIIETLREHPVDFGEGIDTDMYIGLACVITIKHVTEDRRDGKPGKYYSEVVKDVLPASLIDDMQRQEQAQPRGQQRPPTQDPWATPGVSSSEPPF